MKRAFIISALLTISVYQLRAATSFFETTTDYTVELESYSPLYYVQELHNTLIDPSTTASPNMSQLQADFKARTIYTGNGTSPYSIVMNTSSRFVDRESERNILADRYQNFQMDGSVINGIQSNHGITLAVLGIFQVNNASGTSSSIGSNYDNLFAGGPTTAFDVTLSMDFIVDQALDWQSMANRFNDVNKLAFGPIDSSNNSFPFAPVAIVEDWTYNTNEEQAGLGANESSGSYSRSFYFNSEAEAFNFGSEIKTEEDELITLSERGIGPFLGFFATNVSSNAAPEPSSFMLSCMASLMLIARRKR